MRRRTPTLLAVAAAAVLVALSGCASADDGAEPGTTASATSATGDTSSSAPATGDARKTVEVTVSVQNGKVEPEPRRVDVPLGSEIRLQITSDVDDEVHVHGFDVEESLEAGRTTTITLQADQKGVFEVETHETELQLVQLEVR